MKRSAIIILVEIAIGVLLSVGGLAIDYAMYDPPADKPSFMFPICMMMAMMFSAAVIGVTFILLLIVALFRKLF